jgi:hypothetical protein
MMLKKSHGLQCSDSKACVPVTETSSPTDLLLYYYHHHHHHHRRRRRRRRRRLNLFFMNLGLRIFVYMLK